MGGRGGASGRGGGAISNERRGKVDHHAPDYVGYSKAIDMLVEETGMDRQLAEHSYSALTSYFGTGYSSIREGEPPSAVLKGKLIDNALSKSRPYKGEIYRGIHLDADEYAEFSKGLQKGYTTDMRGISSWSSKKTVAESFASGGSSNSQSVIFSVKSTKYGKPVQHLSSFGKGEAEVLAPSFAKYKIKDFFVNGSTTYVNLAEI